MPADPLRVLVIEDDPTDFVFVRKGFEAVAAGVELFHCPSAQQVIPMMESRACRLVMLDLNLNGDDGFRVLAEIRGSERFATVPVIVFSSSSSARDIAASYAAGANAYVEKPLTIEAYRTFARAFSAFWMEVACIA